MVVNVKFYDPFIYYGCIRVVLQKLGVLPTNIWNTQVTRYTLILTLTDGIDFGKSRDSKVECGEMVVDKFVAKIQYAVYKIESVLKKSRTSSDI